MRASAVKAGAAAGAGFSLALMCDLRLASEDAFFVVAYGRIGASPDGGMTYFLPADTWWRLAIWTALGFAIYGAYGYRNSRLRQTS